MGQVKTRIGTLILTAVCTLFLAQSVYSQNDQRPNPDAVRSRILELKKKRLIDMLKLSSDQEQKFLSIYDEAQKRIDEAKKAMDGKIEQLQQALRKGNDSEITTLTDELIRSYENLTAMQKERVKQLKPMLTHEQYAKLLMFELRFPEVLQKLMMRRGMNNNPEKDAPAPSTK